MQAQQRQWPGWGRGWLAWRLGSIPYSMQMLVLVERCKILEAIRPFSKCSVQSLAAWMRGLGTCIPVGAHHSPPIVATTEPFSSLSISASFSCCLVF